MKLRMEADKRKSKEVGTFLEQFAKGQKRTWPLSAFWSRRITNEQRIVYEVDDNSIFIAQLRYHY